MSGASRVLVAVRVQATAERAFTAFTEQIGQWWRPNGLFEFTAGPSGTMAFEPGVGGRLVERHDDGSEFEVGPILVWDPPHRLVVEWRQERFGPDQSTELHVTFDEVASFEQVRGHQNPGDHAPAIPVQTRVTVEHFGWDQFPAEHAARHGFPLPVLQRRLAEWWQEQLHALGESTTTEPGQRS